MESSNFTSYYPIIQHYEPEKMPELVLNGSETPQFIHCHENLDQLPQGLPKTVLVYAKVKKEIEYLEELLKNYSIKEKPTLYFDLTKILSYEHSSLALLSSIIDTVINLKIRQLQTDPFWQNPEKWQIASSIPAIVEIYQDPADPRPIICKHSHHENLLTFKSYKELCCWMSLLKADIAYFNNIENAEVWLKGFSHLSEKLFKFFVDVHKITDETHLNILEKIELKLREQFINIRIRNLTKHAAAPLQRPSQFIASPLPNAPGNAIPIGSPSQTNFQINHRPQESGLPTNPTPLPSPQRQPNTPTILTPSTFPSSQVFYRQPISSQSLNETLKILINEKNEVEIFKFIVRHLDFIGTKYQNQLLIINHFSDPTRSLIDLLEILVAVLREETDDLKVKMCNLFKVSIIQILYAKSLANHHQQESNLPPLPAEMLESLMTEKNEVKILELITGYLKPYVMETIHKNSLLYLYQISNPTIALIKLLGLLELLIKENRPDPPKTLIFFKHSILKILYENYLKNHRQQEPNLPTTPTQLPTPQGQPNLPTTPTQLPAAPSQAIAHTNSSSNNSSQVPNKESHKRKKSSTASSKKGKKKSVEKPSTRSSKKSKTKTTAESPSENVPREEAIQNNQTTTQRETLSAERVEAPINREENLEKEKELDWFDSIINGFDQEISDFSDIEDPLIKIS